MRILVLSRPIINAGDFLFTSKSLEAFKVLRPSDEVVSGHLSQPYELDFLNSFDGIVIAGGPIYDDRFLKKEALPILKYIHSIEPKFYFMSNGWYGETDDINKVFEYNVEEEVRENLFAIEKKGGSFTCRDFLSETILKNIGLRRVKTIGCSAWYDYEFVDYLHVRNVSKGINKIIISDQGMTKNSISWEWQFGQICKLVEYIKNKFPKSNILFTFNGGINTKYSKEYNMRITEYLKKMQIDYFDISGSAMGFSIYDDANLHIGFRVHSHIYCMSKRIPTILLEEDARGAGTNRAMGLQTIRNYRYAESSYSENTYMIKQIDYYLDDLIQSKFKLLEPAYRIMNMTFHDKFVPFVFSVGE